MIRILLPLFAVFVLGACGASNPVNSSGESKPAEPATQVAGSESKAAAPAMPANPTMSVTISELIPYKKGAPIAKNIQTECILNEQLSQYIQNYGGEHNLAVKRAPAVTDKHRGKVLLVEIDNAVSQGNAFIGHRKYVKVSGVLYDNSKKVAAFTGARISGGGFWGGFKGSCAVLERTVNTLGRDIAQWLTNPIDGMHLGDGI